MRRTATGEPQLDTHPGTHPGSQKPVREQDIRRAIETQKDYILSVGSPHIPPTPGESIMSTSLHRRQWLTSTCAAAAGFCFTFVVRRGRRQRRRFWKRTSSASSPTCIDGWPTLARCRNGQLLLVCSGGREAHVCPFGRVELMRSHDQGQTWTWPEIVMDGPIDDRDAGVLETAKARSDHDVHFAGLRVGPHQGGEGRPVAGRSLGSVAGRPFARQGGAAQGRTQRLDDPLDRRRGHVQRPVRQPGQQPARPDSAGGWTPAVRRQGPVAAKTASACASRRTTAKPGSGWPPSPIATATFTELPRTARGRDGGPADPGPIRNHNRRIRARRYSANRPTGARPGRNRSRSACGACPRTCCG